MQNNFNPQYNNYPYMNGGQAYGVPKPQAANCQPLTADIVKILRQDNSSLDLKVDQTDIYRAICTHKEPGNGQNTLVQNPDGSYTCTICGETFNFFEGTDEEVDAAIKTILDMFQTCKTIYLDAPNAMTEQYYQMICLLKKFGLLWKHAVRNFAKYENVNNPLNPIGSGYGGFNALNTLLTNPWAMQQQMYQQPMMYNNGQPMMYNNGQPQMQQQMYQQPMMYNNGQPMMYNNGQPQMQQQMYQQMYQQPVMGGANPVAYGIPAAPVAPAPGVMPDAQPAAAPAPAGNGEIQQQKVFNV